MSVRRWLAVGTGVGIELAPHYLRVVIVKVRPGGIDILGSHTIENHLNRPAAEWGAEYSGFLRKHGAGHLSATVLLPRREMIVRLISLPGVAERDLEAALTLQLDTLHPYAEGAACWTWARLNSQSSILVGITRRAFVERQVELFAEAGIKVSSFTFSAAAVYSALRLLGAPPAEGFVGLLQTEAGVEAYGESPAKAFYSANYEESWERAAVMAAAELRLTENFVPRELAGIIPSPRRVPGEGGLERADALAYLAAIAAACPRLALPANLLPSAQRTSSSLLLYVPTLALGVLLVLLLVALGFYSRYEDRKYLKAVNAEVLSLEPRARRVAQIDQRVEKTRARIRLLDGFQSRTKSDLDALREATRVIPAPAWLNTLELTRATLVVAGESDQATGLLRALDNSPQFQNSEFMVPLSRVGNVEVFRIRAAREGGSQ